MSWLSGWSKRIRLTIDKDDIDGVLSDFPVLVYISAASGIGDVDASCVFDELKVNANRKKIAITTDGIECYVEIEKWDDVNEKAWLWVKVPSIASETDTELYLYYDRGRADNTTYVGDTNSTPAESVWDANFKAVYHMADGVDNAHIYDSTGNDNDGTKKGANEPNEVDGQIGKAQEFDITDDYIVRANPPDFNFGTGDFTLEVLVKADAGITRRFLIDKYIGIGYSLEFQSSGTLRFFIRDATHTTNNTATSALRKDDSNYHLATALRKVNDIELYVDGVFEDSNTPGAVNVTAVVDFHLGSTRIPDNFLDGIEDEVRISNVARSAEWIKATSESIFDDLLAFGSEELTPLSARKYIVELRNSDGDLVSILHNAYDISLSEAINEAPLLDFSIPADDIKAADLTRANEVWLRNYKTGAIVKKFRLNLRRDTR